MAPPPTSSSPHRFLVNKRVQKPNTPGPSKLSQQVSGDSNEASATRPTSGPTPSQFARAPRFAVREDRRASFPPRSPSPNKSRFPFSSTVTAGRSDRVQDVPEDDDDEEMLDSGNVHITLADPWSQESIPDPTKPAFSTPYLPQPPKRRKVDVGDASSTPQSTPGRFTLSSTQTSQAFSNTGGAQPNRPAFLMASIPPPEPAEPLPEAFSPRRRGQKFVAGGLAAEVQSWVIEAGQAANQSRRGRSVTRGEDTVYVYTIKVTEAQGDGPVFVRGQMTDRRQAKAVLIPSQKEGDVRVGDVVGIRMPTWEVQVLGESWVVGVDWRTVK